MTDGPTEILVQILSRLPVKSLLRFRCVSKPWCELIDSPYFIKSHLNQSAKTNTNLNVLFGGLSTLYSVDLDSPECATKLDNPLKRDKYGAKVLGCCNGLVCLSTTSASDNEISLWNPLTGKCKRVPEMPVHFSPNSSRRFCIEGFGYDSVNDDYKLVRVVQSCNIDSNFVESEINVYSLKSDSWRRVGDFPYYICYQRSYGAFANGALQWVVSKKPEPNIDYLIAAFDLGTEEFHLLPQPRYLDKILNINLGVLGNCLSVICNHHMLCVDIWVMKEYGVKESWTKLISIARPDGFKPLPYVRPLAYSKSGREVLLEEDSEKLVWYDLVKKTIQVVTIRDMPPYFVADAYLGSLVQPKSAG